MNMYVYGTDILHKSKEMRDGRYVATTDKVELWHAVHNKDQIPIYSGLDGVFPRGCKNACPYIPGAVS